MRIKLTTPLRRPACEQDTGGNDRITKNYYTNRNELSEVRTGFLVSERQLARFSYTANGQVDRVTDANGNVADYTYDGFDRRVRWDLPSKTTPGAVDTGANYKWTYDASSNVTSFDNRGALTTYTHDDLDRVKTMTAANVDVDYGYDHHGRLTSAETGLWIDAGVVKLEGDRRVFGYDGSGRLVTETTTIRRDANAANDLALGTITSGYDMAGRRTSVAYPGGVSWSYGHDLLGRMTTIHEGASTTTPVVRYVYDDLGRRQQRNAEAAGVVEAYADWSYNSGSRLTELDLHLGGTADDLDLTFSYNAAGQITRRQRSNDGYAFALSPLDRSYTGQREEPVSERVRVAPGVGRAGQPVVLCRRRLRL